MSDYELYHYGVLGMKWGIRKAARKATKDLRKQRNKDWTEATNALEKASRTWIGKNRRKAANDRYEQAQDKFNKSEAEYQQAYKKAKEDAANKLYSKQDSKTNKTVANMSTGKALAQSFLLGSYGSLKYNEAKSRGESTGKAAAEGILHNWANNMTMGALSAGKYLENRSARK